jgi:hypothetical protein
VNRFTHHWHCPCKIDVWNCFQGIAKMIMFKIGAAIVGASFALGLLLTFAPGVSADVALAVVACFS